MGKLNIQRIRYLEKETLRVLTAIELGTRNHEIVPVELICSLSRINKGQCSAVLSELVRHKLIAYDRSQYDGYRLTYPGYDCLALKAMTNKGSISSVGSQIGVGKESDIYLVADDEEEVMALKFQRLGRISFRGVKNNRDYLQNRRTSSWLYLSRLAAAKEYAFMTILYENGFPVPRPIDQNRHCVVMELVQGKPLCQMHVLQSVDNVYHNLMDLIEKMGSYGLIHGDFNEFNLMINDQDVITMIDFPQMISTSHANAEWYFDRDVKCVQDFFAKRFHFEHSRIPKFGDLEKTVNLDVQVAASGFTRQKQKLFEEMTKQQEGETDSENEGDSDDDDDNTHVEEASSSQVDSSPKSNFVAIPNEIDSDEEGEGLFSDDDGDEIGEKLDEQNNKDKAELNNNRNNDDNNNNEDNSDLDSEDEDDEIFKNTNSQSRPFRENVSAQPSHMRRVKKSRKELDQDAVARIVKGKVDRKHKGKTKIKTNAQKFKDKNRAGNKKIIKESAGWDF